MDRQVNDGLRKKHSMLKLCGHFTTKSNTKEKQAGIRFWHDPKTLQDMPNGFLDSNLHQTLILGKCFLKISIQLYIQGNGPSYGDWLSLKCEGKSVHQLRQMKMSWHETMVHCRNMFCKPKCRVSSFTQFKGVWSQTEVKVHSQAKQPEHDWLLWQSCFIPIRAIFHICVRIMDSVLNFDSFLLYKICFSSSQASD